MLACLESKHSANSDALHDASAFAVFGFDVLLDEQLRPLVLELNSQPNVTDFNMKRRLAEEGFPVARADQSRSADDVSSRVDCPSEYAGTYYRRIAPSPLSQEAQRLIGSCP